MTDLHMHDSTPDASGLHMPTILCCLCGTRIESNPANMCVNCLKTQVDITEGITKQVTLFWCRGCGRYQRPPYVAVELESREMLALCLKKIKGLHKDVKLVDASFIWTEPHSKRIKVKLTIQKEVFHGAILQQIFVVEFIIQNQQCEDCQKSYTEHTWTAVVQIRQKVEHKKSMLYLEQMILKHNICEKAMSIKEMPGGLDIYWGSKSGANHLVEFLRCVVPIRSKMSKKLISQDDNSNIFNYKFSMYAELAPICKDDLVLLEPKLAHALGGVSPLMLCTRVTASLHLLDPISLKLVDVSAGTYWHNPFRAQMQAKQMIEYVILDIEKIDSAEKERDNDVTDLRPFNKQSLALNTKLCLANVTCARASDIGVNDDTFECQTHLGHMLKPGDSALGYDLTNANLNDNIEKRRGRRLPDVILVRKSYPNKKNRSRRRQFQLKVLPKEEPDRPLKKSELARNQAELEEFMNEIEEDPELQGKVNLYKKRGVVQSKREHIAMDEKDETMNDEVETEAAAAGDDDDDEDEEEGELPQVDVDQLLDDFGAVTIGAPDENAGKDHIEHGSKAAEEETDWQAGDSSTSTKPAALSKNKK